MKHYHIKIFFCLVFLVFSMQLSGQVTRLPIRSVVGKSAPVRRYIVKGLESSYSIRNVSSTVFRSSFTNGFVNGYSFTGNRYFNSYGQFKLDGIPDYSSWYRSLPVTSTPIQLPPVNVYPVRSASYTLPRTSYVHDFNGFTGNRSFNSYIDAAPMADRAGRRSKIDDLLEELLEEVLVPDAEIDSIAVTPDGIKVRINVGTPIYSVPYDDTIPHPGSRSNKGAAHDGKKDPFSVLNGREQLGPFQPISFPKDTIQTADPKPLPDLFP